MHSGLLAIRRWRDLNEKRSALVTDASSPGKESSSYTGSDKLCRQYQASSEYIVSRTHPYKKNLCICQNRELI